MSSLGVVACELCHLGLSRLREELVGGDEEVSLPHWVVILALHIVIVIDKNATTKLFGRMMTWISPSTIQVRNSASWVNLTSQVNGITSPW